MVLRLAPIGTAIPQPGRDNYTIMGIGLVAAFGVITLTLPAAPHDDGTLNDPLQISRTG